MGENSGIQWTDHTFNHIRGCVEVSPGCANCYARELAKRNPAVFGVWGKDGTRVMAGEKMQREPLLWNRKAEKERRRDRVFCASLADVFEEWDGPIMDASGTRIGWKEGDLILCGDTKPDPRYGERYATMDDARESLFRLIQQTPNLDWLLLTKRPENIEPQTKRITDTIEGRQATLWSVLHSMKNVWIGTTVENQEQADKRIPTLLQVPAAVRFLSVEPMLGPVGIIRYLRGGGIHWVICGGESGAKARPFELKWARDLRDQCQAAGVPFFMKQVGSQPRGLESTPYRPARYSGNKVLNDPHGGDPAEWPEDLRIREEPIAA